MKTPPIFCAMILAISFLFFCNHPITAQSLGVTFAVSSVEKADTLLAESPYRNAIANFVNTKNETAPWESYADDSTQQAQPSVRLEAFGASPKASLLTPRSVHPFLHAVHLAYAEHRPLTLSPDMLWLVIAQGFAAHVDANADSLRHLFVIHEGRKVLNVRRDDYVRGDSLFPWPEVFVSLRNQVDANTNAQLAELLTPQFSTTGIAETAAYEVALMDAMSKYFVYSFSVLCGIPEITLEGAPEDWAALEERADRLEAYGLKWWLDDLKPILHEFTLASQGKPDTAFWQNMYKITEADAGCTTVEAVNGWVLQLFPYIQEKPNPWVSRPDSVTAYRKALAEGLELRKDPAIQRKLAKEPKTRKQFSKLQALYSKISPEPYLFGLQYFELSDFPLGISNADLLVDYHGDLLAYEMCAGFVGIGQDAATKSLRPEINWFIVDKNTTAPAEDAALYQKWLESLKDSVSKD